jgi:hypothetical protein
MACVTFYTWRAKNKNPGPTIPKSFLIFKTVMIPGRLEGWRAG